MLSVPCSWCEYAIGMCTVKLAKMDATQTHVHAPYEHATVSLVTVHLSLIMPVLCGHQIGMRQVWQ